MKQAILFLTLLLVPTIGHAFLSSEGRHYRYNPIHLFPGDYPSQKQPVVETTLDLGVGYTAYELITYYKGILCKRGRSCRQADSPKCMIFGVGAVNPVMSLVCSLKNFGVEEEFKLMIIDTQSSDSFSSPWLIVKNLVDYPQETPPPPVPDPILPEDKCAHVTCEPNEEECNAETGQCEAIGANPPGDAGSESTGNGEEETQDVEKKKGWFCQLNTEARFDGSLLFPLLFFFPALGILRIKTKSVRRRKKTHKTVSQRNRRLKVAR